MAPDFLENNFLSNDKRYPLTKIETNSARAFGTNAKAGHVWDNFSSQTYKELSPVDELEFFNPFDETRPIKFKPKDRNVAPGYYRTPSLVSLWSSAPFLHNNMLGKFTGDPSVAGRMERLQRCGGKIVMAGKAAEQGFYLAHPKRVRAAFAQGIRAETAASDWLIRMATLTSDPSRKAHQST